LISPIVIPAPPWVRYIVLLSQLSFERTSETVLLFLGLSNASVAHFNIDRIAESLAQFVRIAPSPRSCREPLQERLSVSVGAIN
jgi:hypothetical protein